ncbi:MAG TPA: polysaccharide biosynthesis protein [Thermodesulfobacteriaceae bacterium]|nr:polysaccharide biosynthesis protein [Thermodesulfobacteriaceae bacterium]
MPVNKKIRSRAVRLLRTRWAVFVHDILMVPASVYMAFWVRHNLSTIPDPLLQACFRVIAIAVPVQMLLFWHFGLYRGIWRFASLPDLTRILKAVTIGTLITTVILFIIGRAEYVPRSLLLLYPVFLCLGLASPRLLYRWYRDRQLGIRRNAGQRALIAGAGRSGEILVRDLLKEDQYQPVAFVDDDPVKRSRDLHGVRVMGTLEDIPRLAEKYAVDVVLLAMPTADSTVIQRIVRLCQELELPCRTLPSIAELADGKVEISRLREIQIEDLLGREQVRLDREVLHVFLKGRRVMVTGAGGSIGSELCRQISRFEPDTLVMVDNGEYNLYRIQHEMRARLPGERWPAILGDVRDWSRMNFVFERFRPHVVFHAAAYKHVPLVEQNPVEGIKTNILGTKTVADIAVKKETEKFVMISTDKAVNPTNIMGASKRVAEMYCQNRNGRVQTRFITTRFGNVLGSTGSVVPLFRKQIAMGGPVTVTHPDMKRYFMTIPEACQLILQAGAIGTGGEIFVLDMGEPVRIDDLARQMIRLSGFEPGRDIRIEYTGIRPGEKLYEELFYSSEALAPTRHPKIRLARAHTSVTWKEIEKMLEILERSCEQYDIPALRMILKDLVPEYEEEDDTVFVPAYSVDHPHTLH